MLTWTTFSCSVNVGCGPAEERVLLTGLHAVADIYCENCKTTLGWKYVSPPIVAQQNLLFFLFVFYSLKGKKKRRHHRPKEQSRQS